MYSDVPAIELGADDFSVEKFSYSPPAELASIGDQSTQASHLISLTWRGVFSI
jgi:hypothetical protein